MSDEIDSIYADSDACYCQDQVNWNGFNIYYILYGYERDSLQDLFPILVIADDGRGVDDAENAVISFLEEDNRVYIRAPGRYNPPATENSETICQIEFTRLSPSSDPEKVDGTGQGHARGFCMELLHSFREEQGNLYSSTTQPSSIEYAVFWIDYVGWPEVQLPFPTEEPVGEEYVEHSNTIIPCYLLTDEYDQRQLKRPLRLRWLYPVV